MRSKPYGMAVSAFISDGSGKILLLQRVASASYLAGLWETPGGKIDSGESFDQALLREVREEAGLSIALDGVAGISEFELPHVKVVVVYMNAHVVEGEVCLSEEHQDYAWLPISELSSMGLTPALQRVLNTVSDN
jgi:8-oxo-dGTP diphosphatase